MSESRLTLPVGERDHIAGPDDAPVTLVEYGDLECPHCRMAHPIVKAVRRALGDKMRFVFRHFPLKEIHPHAYHAAQVAEVAAQQGKFWEMHDLIFENQHALEDEDLARYAKTLGIDDRVVAEAMASNAFYDRVREDFRSGVRSGVNGTPTFFINGERYNGPWADERRFVEVLREVASTAV